jgi:hypothetical protein
MLCILHSMHIKHGECSFSTADIYWKRDKLHLGIHNLLRFQKLTTFEVENGKLHVCHQRSWKIVCCSQLSGIGDLVIKWTKWLFLCNIFTRHFLVKNLSVGGSSASVARWLTLQKWTLNCTVTPVVFKINGRHGPRRKHGLYCWRGVFSAPLHSNCGGAEPHRNHRSSIVARVYCLAMAVSLAPQFLNGANKPQPYTSQPTMREREIQTKKAFPKGISHPPSLESSYITLRVGGGGTPHCLKARGIEHTYSIIWRAWLAYVREVSFDRAQA